jgi:hypothetical protein
LDNACVDLQVWLLAIVKECCYQPKPVGQQLVLNHGVVLLPLQLPLLLLLLLLLQQQLVTSDALIPPLSLAHAFIAVTGLLLLLLLLLLLPPFHRFLCG